MNRYENVEIGPLVAECRKGDDYAFDEYTWIINSPWDVEYAFDIIRIVIEEGVYIGGIDVSGMTAKEATEAVDAYVADLQEQWITLVGPKNTLKYQLKDLGLSAKTSVAVQEAVAVLVDNAVEE